MQLLFLLFAVEVGSIFETLSCHHGISFACISGASPMSDCICCGLAYVLHHAYGDPAGVAALFKYVLTRVLQCSTSSTPEAHSLYATRSIVSCYTESVTVYIHHQAIAHPHMSICVLENDFHAAMCASYMTHATWPLHGVCYMAAVV